MEVNRWTNSVNHHSRFHYLKFLRVSGVLENLVEEAQMEGEWHTPRLTQFVQIIRSLRLEVVQGRAATNSP